MENKEKTWHRQPEETEIAFRAFSIYLNQPAPRKMSFMNKATTHSQTSLLKWQKMYHWVERATDYDNARSDLIMMRDVSVITQYQQKVVESGLEDMQMLRIAWAKSFERVMSDPELTPNQMMEAVNALTTSRLKIEQLARVSTKLPERYGKQNVEDNTENNPSSFIQLTLAGPKTEEIEDGKYSERETSTTERTGSEALSAASETEGNQDESTAV